MITNLLIDLDGDRAKVRANLIATFVHRADAPGAHFDIGERYQPRSCIKPVTDAAKG